jgi:hypothetical protein
MRPFETADVASVEILKARYETNKAQLATAEEAQDAQRAAAIATELRDLPTKQLPSFFELPIDSRRSRKSAHALGGDDSQDRAAIMPALIPTAPRSHGTVRAAKRTRRRRLIG